MYSRPFVAKETILWANKYFMLAEVQMWSHNIEVGTKMIEGIGYALL